MSHEQFEGVIDALNQCAIDCIHSLSLYLLEIELHQMLSG